MPMAIIRPAENCVISEQRIASGVPSSRRLPSATVKPLNACSTRSFAGRSAHSPTAPNPLQDSTMRLGFAANSAAGSRPAFVRRDCGQFVSTTSTDPARRASTAHPASVSSSTMIDHRARRRRRRAVFSQLGFARHQTRHGLHDPVVARAHRPGTASSERRQITVDEVRLDRPQGVVVDAELRRHVGPIVDQHDIDVLHKAVDDGLRLFAGQSQRDAILAAIERLIGPGFLGREHHLQTPGLAFRRLDLCYIRAELREELPREGRSDDLRELEYRDSLQRSRDRYPQPVG